MGGSQIKCYHLEFETSFLSAFFPDDYEDLLAEQEDKKTESVRDFAFAYRALCKRWYPSLTEANIVKMMNHETLFSLVISLKRTMNHSLNIIDEWGRKTLIHTSKIIHLVDQVTKSQPLFCV